MTINRRQFNRHALGASFAAATMGTLSPAQAEEKEASVRLPIVDTHQHLWDLKKFRLPWLASAPELDRSYLTKDYLMAIKGLNVVKAVYMEVDVDPAQQVEEAEHVIELSKQNDHPTVAAVISGRPGSAAFGRYIRRFKDNPHVKGIRQVLHAPTARRGLCLAEPFVAGMRLLGELDMSFDLCMRPTELGDGLRLVSQCPDTRFILDHCGNADPTAFLPSSKQGKGPSHDPETWRRDISALAEKSNVICKISGIVARAPEGWTADHLAPIIHHCLDAFGPDRVVFGGDWPVCTLAASFRQWVDALRDIIASRPADHQRKLLHDNAVRLYGLA